jgi:AraC-like DNA-binding protein
VLSGIGLDVVRSEDLDTRVAHAVKILREHPVTRRSLGELAKAVGLSQSRMRHLFSEELGMSFRGYVLWLRIYDALSALGNGASLTDAALSAGFSDAAHFSRTFRRVFGLAPSQLSGAVSLMTARAGPR